MTSGPARKAPHLRLVEGGASRTRTPAGHELDDTELLTAVRSGDPSIATAFHDRIRPQVDRTIRRLLGPNDTDAEDLAQMALVELITSIDRYRGDCSLDSFTSTVTAHVVYKKLRRRQLERRVFWTPALGEEAAEPEAPTRVGRDASTRELMARIRKHLAAMEESRAWAFLLHDVQGYDLRETAEIMGVSVAAAQSRLVRGRRELHGRIAEDPELAQTMNELSEGGT